MKTILNQFNTLDERLTEYWHEFDHYWLNKFEQWQKWYQQKQEKWENERIKRKVEYDNKCREFWEQCRKEQFERGQPKGSIWDYVPPTPKKAPTQTELLQQQNNQLTYIRIGLAAMFLWMIITFGGCR